METLRLVAMSLVITLLILLGSSVIYKDEIAVVSGNISIDASSSKTVEVNYPTGYNKNNCVVVSNGLALHNDTNGKGYNYYGIYSSSSDALNNAFRRRINLTDTKVKLFVENPNNESLSLDYKIVLMKTV